MVCRGSIPNTRVDTWTHTHRCKHFQLCSMRRLCSTFRIDRRSRLVIMREQARRVRVPQGCRSSCAWQFPHYGVHEHHVFSQSPALDEAPGLRAGHQGTNNGTIICKRAAPAASLHGLLRRFCLRRLASSGRRRFGAWHCPCPCSPAPAEAAAAHGTSPYTTATSAAFPHPFPRSAAAARRRPCLPPAARPISTAPHPSDPVLPRGLIACPLQGSWPLRLWRGERPRGPCSRDAQMYAKRGTAVSSLGENREAGELWKETATRTAW
jgi:hypothetical protein